MLPSTLLLSILSLLLSPTHTISPQQQPIPHTHPQQTYRIPTLYESTVLARRMLNLSTLATLSTVFEPSSYQNALNHDPYNLNRPRNPPPPDIQGSPIGLMEYYATCPPRLSNPTLLAISIATPYLNSKHGSNVSLSLRWVPPPNHQPSSDPFLYSPANMPRFSLQGYIERVPDQEVEEYKIQECFLERHKEVIWTPGNDIHESWWARIVVTGVYWFGGFGDRAAIGWLDLDEWESVTEAEVEKARLVGEEGFVPPVPTAVGEEDVLEDL